MHAKWLDGQEEAMTSFTFTSAAKVTLFIPTIILANAEFVPLQEIFVAVGNSQ
jgi:hypothetical protein